MKIKQAIFLVAVLACMAAPAASGQKVTATGSPPQTVSLYDRVMKSGRIRAAYTIYPPGCFKDENGKLKGVFVETLEEAAKNLGLTVEWTEEVGRAAQIEGLENDRYDMIGSAVWANPERAKLATLSSPLYYSPFYLYARKDDPKFNENIRMAALNSPKVRIAMVAGSTAEAIAKDQFPNATRVALPRMTDYGVSFLNATSNKADIIIMEKSQAMKLLESNPGTIVNIKPSVPLRVIGNCYMFKRNELEFQNMLNSEINDLLTSGFVERQLEKYEKYPNSQLRIAPPYWQN
ncbi:MAG: substrate-binding periplasmic protein [Limisphaerales bacterium]